jgi:hypothetical protein
MFTRSALSLLVVVATAATLGCDDGASTVIGAPDPSAPFTNRAIFVGAPSIQAVPAVDAGCPHSRFIVPFDLVITADSSSDVFLSQVQMQFANQAGALTPPTMITQPNLSTPFASTPVPAMGSRTFPFKFPLGCGAVPPGMLHLMVFTRDSQHREQQTPLRVPVR